MPDVRYVGGITGIMKLNAVLEAYDVLVSPHNMCSVITCAASLHVSAAMKNFMHLEYHPEEAPWLPEFSDRYWYVEDGCFELPEGPGLGVNLDEKKMKEHPYEKAQPVRLNMLGA
jgi:L-alanine-DL-glutamate epimerase-like enolase superfamily enzyme